mgnify:CR=1 FL=1
MTQHAGAQGGLAAPAGCGFFLVGATASGKTAVAHCLAEQLGGEILSADSMLVYAGMDIGTAKPDAAARRRVRYHGLDLTTPDQPFSVGRYLASVRLSLADSPAARTPRPEGGLLVAGGTGLYARALTQGLADAPPANPSVRAYWTDVLEEQGLEPLQAELQRRSPGLYGALADPQNPRRLIRALELAAAGLGRREPTWAAAAPSAPLAGLRRAPEDLNRRIEERVRAMFRGGFVDEVRVLQARWPQTSETARQAIGYAEARAYLAGALSLAQAEEQTVIRTRQLAKRQRTWFAHQADVRWIDAAPDEPAESLARRVLEHWRTHGPTALRC